MASTPRAATRGLGFSFLRNIIPRFGAKVFIAALVLLSGAASATADATTAADAGGIAFVRRVEAGWQIFVSATPEAAARQLTFDPDEKRDPCWSPDGRRLAYATHRGEVFIVDAAGGSPLKSAGREHGFFAQPVWRPDGRALFMVRYVTAPSDDSDLWTVELDGASPSTPQLYYSGEGMEHFPAVSLPEKALYYSLYMPKREKPPVIEELCRMDLASQHVEEITQLAADSRRAAASRVDGRLAFSTNKNGNFDLWLLEKDRRMAPLVEHPGNDDHPSWSPDGQEIVFESTRDGKPQLWIVNVASKLVRKMTSGDNEEREPAWGSGGPAAGEPAVRRHTP